MKKIFLLLIAVSCFGQISLTEAVDFTGTDSEGNEHQLFDLLNEGKYVMLDFYAYWCGPCCTIAPDIKMVFEEYGCNTADFHMLSIELEATSAQFHAFETDCGGGSPGIIGTEGGGGIHSLYSAQAMPTIILVAPDGQIVEQDIWPFSFSIVETLLTSYGIEKSSCEDVVVPEPPVSSFSLSVTESSDDSMTVEFENSSMNSNSWSWDFGDGNFSNEENPSHTYTTEGDYVACLTAYNDGEETHTSCEDISVAFTASSIEDLNQMGITISNSKGQWTVNTNDQLIDYKLHNLSGQLITDGFGKNIEINKNNLPEGLYLLEIGMENQQYIVKLTK